MPLYQYSCVKCMKMYEVIVKLKDFGKKVPCPHCKEKLQLEIQPVRFSFK